MATDAVLGASAGLLLVVGLLRVFVFEKGGGYYLHSAPFLIKFALFLGLGGAVGRCRPASSSPGARRCATAGRPGPTRRGWRGCASILHWELGGIVVILLCAALMARGIGSF